MKTPTAPLTLYRPQSKPPKGWVWLLTNAKPTVRIYGPVQGSTYVFGTSQRLESGPPWPKEIISEQGTLPEYVQGKKINGRITWVPAKVGERKRGRYRARIDLELVVDGDIIDLNRIPLPKDTPIIDKRFEDK